MVKLCTLVGMVHTGRFWEELVLLLTFFVFDLLGWRNGTGVRVCEEVVFD